MMRKLLALGAAAVLAVTGFAASAAAAAPAEVPEQAIHQVPPKINEVLANTFEPNSGQLVHGIEVYNPARANLRGYGFYVCTSDNPTPLLLGLINESTTTTRLVAASEAPWRVEIPPRIDRYGAVVLVSPFGTAVDAVDFSGGANTVVECLNQMQAEGVSEPAPSPTFFRSAQRCPDYDDWAMVPLQSTLGAPNCG